MTTWQSLLYCAEADVTLDRIKHLIAVTGTEPLTVDFKQGGDTPKIADCIAAMANRHGGLILVGVTDQEREIVGVPREAMAHVADVLATRLESPGWLPQMIEVPLGESSPDRYVLVLRINPDTAPRPVFVQGKGGVFWAPIRMPGSTRQATRDELYALFTEARPGAVAEVEWSLNRPDIPRTADGGPDDVDLIMFSGLQVPVGPAAWGRPMSERAVTNLAGSLDHSPLPEALFRLAQRPRVNVESFHAEGPANRSNVTTLVWRLEPGNQVPFELTASAEVPGHYGRSHVGMLELTLKLTSRLTAWLKADQSPIPPPPVKRWLEVAEWATLLDAMAETLTSTEVVGVVADLADVDAITVRQPRILHVVSGPSMADLLPAQLRPIRGGGLSYGAHMQADPALDLSDRAERSEQVDRWLKQMGTDAGLVGMEQLVNQMRAQEAALRPEFRSRTVI